MNEPVNESVGDRLYLGRIVPGMDVCDVTGEKVGSIAHIYQISEETEQTLPAPASQELIEIKSGFLGLGKHYYVPMSDVQEVLTDSIFLSKSREAFEELGYTEKPAQLAGMS